MKYIENEQIDSLPGRRLEPGDRFAFRCHPQIGCFNLCCRNLNLFLYPYDVVRLKRRLGISSGRFLEKHADIVMRDSGLFPEVLLRMSDTPERTCPFLTEEGCTVYPDRPDACRTFPVEQGALYDAAAETIRLIHLFRPPDFCLGQHETEQWTTESWARDQEAVVYNKMTLLWSDIKRRFHTDPWGPEGPDGQKARMAFMASYNIDAFREFIFNSSFLKRYAVKSATLKKIRRNDAELMKFGFDWIRFFVWGIRSKTIKPR